MKDILDTIIAHKREEVAFRKRTISYDSMLSKAESTTHTTVSMRRSLEQSPSGIIAEFKRRSPSKGWIDQEADVATIVQGYRHAGAAACSVLTDTEFFGGCLDDLVEARRVASLGAMAQLPLLRKEFIVDPYQIMEARAAGADAILLIAACLDKTQCEDLAAVAHLLSLEVLLEIHTEQELAHLNSYIDMLGVNNRNLGTFHTDLQNSFRLARAMADRSSLMKRQPLLVSESGISKSETVLELRAAGFRGFLMGEAFMKSLNPALELTNLIDQIEC